MSPACAAGTAWTREGRICRARGGHLRGFAASPRRALVRWMAVCPAAGLGLADLAEWVGGHMSDMNYARGLGTRSAESCLHSPRLN